MAKPANAAIEAFGKAQQSKSLCVAAAKPARACTCFLYGLFVWLAAAISKKAPYAANLACLGAFRGLYEGVRIAIARWGKAGAEAAARLKGPFTARLGGQFNTSFVLLNEKTA